MLMYTVSPVLLYYLPPPQTQPQEPVVRAPNPPNPVPVFWGFLTSRTESLTTDRPTYNEPTNEQQDQKYEQ